MGATGPAGADAPIVVRGSVHIDFLTVGSHSAFGTDGYQIDVGSMANNVNGELTHREIVVDRMLACSNLLSGITLIVYLWISTDFGDTWSTIGSVKIGDGNRKGIDGGGWVIPAESLYCFSVEVIGGGTAFYSGPLSVLGWQ